VSAPVPPLPRRPVDVPAGAVFRDVVVALEAHGWALLTSRHGGPRLTRDEVAAHCLALLTLGHVLADRLRLGQWVNVRDALQHGATVEQVAEAMELTPIEITFGLRSWADAQLTHGLMSAVDHAAVLALVEPISP
jgi:hypothetical protein